jgi:hypothetical protein
MVATLAAKSNSYEKNTSNPIFALGCCDLFIMFFQLAELIVISKLCGSTLSNCTSSECQTVTHHNTMTSVVLSGERVRTCVPRVLNMTYYIFSTHLQLSNGKQLSPHQETRPKISGFPLGCCDHSTLWSAWWIEILRVGSPDLRDTWRWDVAAKYSLLIRIPDIPQKGVQNLMLSKLQRIVLFSIINGLWDHWISSS